MTIYLDKATAQALAALIADNYGDLVDGVAGRLAEAWEMSKDNARWDTVQTEAVARVERLQAKLKE